MPASGEIEGIQTANKIWVKLFKENNRTYCYDVGSNSLLEIDGTLADVLHIYDYSNKNHVLETLAGKYPEKRLQEAIRTIHQFNNESGGFIPVKSIQLRFPFSKDEYRLLLHNLVNHVVLNVTEDCNFRCLYCQYGETYRHVRSHTSRSMSIELIRDSIDFMVARADHIVRKTDRNLSVGFYGGEPLLEKNKIFQAVEYIKKNHRDIFPRFNFNMTINGSLLDRDTIRRLAEYNFSLVISIDGPADVHNRYRLSKERGETFEVIKEKIALIKRMEPEYFKQKVKFNVVTAPEFKIKEVIDFFREHFPETTCTFTPVSPHDTAFFNDFDMKHEYSEYDNEFKEIENEYIDKKAAGAPDYYLDGLFDVNLLEIHQRLQFPLPDMVFPNGICLPGLKRIFVDVDGGIHMCEKINPGFGIGTVRNGFDFDSIFRHIDRYIETTGHCDGCWAVRFCSECFLSSIKGDTFSKERKEMNCRLREEKLLADFRTYTRLMQKAPTSLDNLTYTSQPDMLKVALDFLGKNH